jgi:hypothetical protein
MRETLSALTAAEQREWLLGAASVLGVMGLAFFIESLFFRRSGRVGSWLKLRLVSLVMAPLTALAVVLPARAVSGMEGLAVFYLTLLTIGPLLWFGSHVQCGRRLRPALNTSEACLLAVSGLFIYSIPVTAFMAAEYPLREAARQQAGKASPGAAPLPHAVGAARRFEMPGAGLVFTQSLIAPPGLVLERIDSRQNGPWYDTAGVTHPLFCTRGGDLHAMWSVQEPAPQLRLHWVDAGGKRGVGEYIAAPGTQGAAAAEPFTIGFRADGFDPAAPIPRSRAFLVFTGTDGKEWIDMLSFPQEGEPRESDCLLTGYRRVAPEREGPVRKVAIRFYLPSGKPTLIGEIRRPDPAPAAAEK